MHRLIPHPAFRPKLVTAVDVEIIATLKDMRVRFSISGQEHVNLADQASPGRRDELWKTTCFELFIKDVGSLSYYEFNFSPSTEWAAYRFENYRAGMAEMTLSVAPSIKRGRGDSDYIIEVVVNLSDRPPKPSSVALCAVIEEKGGTKSYWALTHPPGKPDFHHPDCFTLQFEAPKLP